ncbi:MAG: hypothetical protein V4520_11115 [Bacteroidota bacterium]
MAANLARSFLLWHSYTDIQFKLITDQQDLIPADLKHKIQVHAISHGEFGEGFSSKLHLDEFASEGQTLFIDSDCLIFDNIEFLFERFKGRAVSVVGNYIKDGEWFGDIKSIITRFNIPHLPKFNGGIYYLEKGATASSVYTTARKLEAEYDSIGFVRLRNRPNDEVLMSLAMQLHSQEPILDDGTIMSDPQACPGGYQIDVIKGKRWLLNPRAPSPLHQHWYPFTKVSPAIVHFLGYYTTHYPYKREAYRLYKFSNSKLNLWAKLKALWGIEMPMRIKTTIKQKLRPIYRLLLGTRKVTMSERV